MSCRAIHMSFSEFLKKGMLTIVFLLLLKIVCLSQQVTLRGNYSPPEVLQHIERQTGYKSIYSPELLRKTWKIDVDFRREALKKALKFVFTGMRLTCKVVDEDRTIHIWKVQEQDAPLYNPIIARVMNQDSELLQGANVLIHHARRYVFTNSQGLFTISDEGPRVWVTITYKGYAPKQVELDNAKVYDIVLEISRVNMDAASVQLYGTTTPRLSTQSMYRVKGSDLEMHSPANVLDALEGMVPGMVIRRSNGVPGSNYEILIRGLNSIAQGRDPLILLDGVPIAGYNSYLSTIGTGSAQGIMGASVLNGIGLSSIASIDIFKDAAATAIYGSRGSNGVILITLKPSLSGSLKLTADVSTGYTQVLKTMPLLNTSQYLDLRTEALQNDGIAVNASTLPEAFAWGTAHTTDFKKFATGGTGMIRNMKISLSGGDTNTHFLVAGNWHAESSVFAGPSSDNRLSVYGNLIHQSRNKQWLLHLSTLYSYETNQLPQTDLSSFILMAPNAPDPIDGGKLVWQRNGLSFVNIAAQELNTYRAEIRNYFQHLQWSYAPMAGLSFRGSLGYNTVVADERIRTPLEAQDPAVDPLGHTFQNRNNYNSTIVEFTPEYSLQIGEDRLEVMAGATWQQERKSLFSLAADGYTSDAALNSANGAASLMSSENKVTYRYEALFGRINYNHLDRYIFTLSGRRDGSSRFGPGNQFGNFGAIGAAWIFSDEAICRRHLDWLKFGKLRGSYGITGNDQIGDNQYAQTYRATRTARGYQGQQGILPVSLYNGDLKWEVNHKSEVAMDLGFLNNRLVFSAAGYRNWSDNQLVYQSLPSQSGIPGVISNQKATLLNTGIELALQSFAGDSSGLRWSSTFYITWQKNRLLHFPGLANSTYAGELVEGQSLNVVYGYGYRGVDRGTGLNTFRDVNNDGVLNRSDWLVGGSLDLTCYGGWQNRLRYKGWELGIAVEARRQHGINPAVLYYMQNPPGMLAPAMLSNVPLGFLGRWRQPGDRAEFQRVTATPGTDAARTLPYYVASNALVADASYIRFKSLSFSYTFSDKWLKLKNIAEARVYLHGQNLWTGTHYRYADPETQNPNVLPPVRSWEGGIQITIK